MTFAIEKKKTLVRESPRLAGWLWRAGRGFRFPVTSFIFFSLSPGLRDKQILRDGRKPKYADGLFRRRDNEKNCV